MTCSFLVTNTMTALLLSIILESEGSTVDEVCLQALTHAPQFNTEQITEGAFVILSAMAERSVL